MRLTGLTLPILLGALLSQVVTAIDPGNPDKPGYCPDLDECYGEQPDNKCHSDEECDDEQKCCHDGCHYVCRDPAVMCPAPQETVCNCSEKLNNMCGHNKKCKEKQLCCQDGCTLSCKDPAALKPGNCPVPPTSTCNCLEKPNNECASDVQCDGIQKCCLDGCQYSCKVPAELTCPLPQKSPCDCSGNHKNKCDSDRDCKRIQQCCTNGCVFSCEDPIVTKSGKCPPVPSPTPACDCSNKPNNECSSDEKCDGTQKCCWDGCRLSCKVPVA